MKYDLTVMGVGMLVAVPVFVVCGSSELGPVGHLHRGYRSHLHRRRYRLAQPAVQALALTGEPGRSQPL